MKKIQTALVVREDAGQTMTEYTLILGVITIGILLSMGALSAVISVAIDRVAELIPG